MLTVKPPPIGLPRVFVATMVMGLVPLALLFVVWLGAAMAQSTHHHPFHYDFYRHWKQPGSTASCCDARITRDGKEEGDCEPTQADLRPARTASCAGMPGCGRRVAGSRCPMAGSCASATRTPSTATSAGITGRCFASCRPIPEAEITT